MGAQLPNNRVKLTDTIMDVFVKMSDGNPGCLNALMEIMKNTDIIGTKPYPKCNIEATAINNNILSVMRVTASYSIFSKALKNALKN